MKFDILVVDDERNIRTGLGKALELDGYDVVLAADGQEALDRIGDSDIDLVITDLKMPRVAGEELLKRLSGSYPTLAEIFAETSHKAMDACLHCLKE